MPAFVSLSPPATRGKGRRRRPLLPSSPTPPSPPPSPPLRQTGRFRRRGLSGAVTRSSSGAHDAGPNSADAPRAPELRAGTCPAGFARWAGCVLRVVVPICALCCCGAIVAHFLERDSLTRAPPGPSLERAPFADTDACPYRGPVLESDRACWRHFSQPEELLSKARLEQKLKVSSVKLCQE